MKKTYLILSIFLFSICSLYAQMPIEKIEKKLFELSVTTIPGLAEPVNFSGSNISIQVFIQGIAQTNNLNIVVDPTLNIKIVNNFTNETPLNILIFLVKEYNLDASFQGSIIALKKRPAPVVVEEKVDPKPKEIKVKYTSTGNLLSLDLEDDNLQSVLRKISMESGYNITTDDPKLQQKKVTVFINNMEFDKAVAFLARSQKLDTIRNDDKSYMLRLPEKESTVKGTRPTGKYPRSKNNKTDLADVDINVSDDGSGNQLISFEANDVPIADLIKLVSEKLGINYILIDEPKDNTTLHLNDVTYDDFLYYVLQGSDHTYKLNSGKGTYTIGERKDEGLRATRVIQLEYRSVDEMLQMIPAEIKKGVQITEFREQNSIILSGSDPQIQEIIEFLEQVDKTVPMVMIEVIMVDIRKNKSFSAGITAGVAAAGDSVSSGGTILGGNGINYNVGTNSLNKFLTTLTAGSSINLGKVAPNFYLNLKALDSKSYANVRSMPKLSTLNGHEANMTIGSTRYYSIETQNFIGTQNPVLSQTQQFNEVQANMSITINPVVSGDDQVTLDIQVEISDFIGTPPDNAPPPSASSQFNSLIRVHNEEMVVLGGLERYEKSESGSGVPILSRIPIIKWLFSAREKTNNKTITTIFIKPTIIY